MADSKSNSREQTPDNTSPRNEKRKGYRSRIRDLRRKTEDEFATIGDALLEKAKAGSNPHLHTLLSITGLGKAPTGASRGTASTILRDVLAEQRQRAESGLAPTHEDAIPSFSPEVEPW